MSEVITVRNVSKRFRIGVVEEKSDSLLGHIANGLKAPLRNLRNLRKLSSFTREEESVYWALRGMDFDVSEGEVLGIIGHNGAGKSTLLKILSRITEPTTGEITIKGRVSSLLEVGTGFHPDLTGRENVYMNGTILGMKKSEIDRKFDEIIEFSGIEKYVDTPVKRYSSGMKVRLGFSVAAHLQPDVLIIDEVLAVGDFHFQQKCLGKMREVGNSGRTVLFVSHNMAAVNSLCTKGLLIKGGHMAHYGDLTETIPKYFAINSTLSLFNRLENTVREGEGKVAFESIEICNSSHSAIKTGDDIVIKLAYHRLVELNHFEFSLTLHFYDGLGRRIFICSPNFTRPITSLSEKGFLTCKLKKLPLPPGHYTISIWSELNREKNQLIEGALQFEVNEGDFYSSGKTAKVGRDVAVLIESFWD